MQDTQETTRALILRYFHAWQEPADLGEMRGCLADSVVSDVGFAKFSGADQLVQMIEDTGTPWQQVTLLESMFSAQAGTLFYEGVAIATGQKTRVGEHVAVKDGKIIRITASICMLG
jgi:hypothetical protein